MEIPELLGSKFLDALDATKRERAKEIMVFSDRVAVEREERKRAVSSSPLVVQALELMEKLQVKRPDLSLRIKDGYFKFTEQIDESQAKKDAGQRIETVYGGGQLQSLCQFLRRLATCEMKEGLKTIEHYPMKNVNLYFEQGKTYLVLGAPRSGKSTLLRMIAGILPEDKDHEVGGTVAINRFDPKSKDMVWSNLVGYALLCVLYYCIVSTFL